MLNACMLGRRFGLVTFARALQKVQIELAHSVTPIDILDDAPPVEEQEEDGEPGHGPHEPSRAASLHQSASNAPRRRAIAM